MADDTIIYDIARLLLECACQALDETTAGCPAKAYVSPGTAAHDDCCDGQLTVAPMRQYPSWTFPEEDYRRAPCGAPFIAIQYDIEIIRCAPTLDNFSRAPTVQEIDDAAKLVSVDMQAVMSATQCCVTTRSDMFDSIIRDQVVIDPNGGCMGSRLTVVLGLTNGCDCD